MSTTIGSSVWLVVSTKTSAVPSRNMATRTTGTFTAPVSSAAVRTTSTSGAHQVDRDDERLAVHAVGEDPGIEPEDEPRQALEQPGQRDEQRVGGLARRPGAVRRRAPIPSPRLPTHEEPTSQRNGVPMRAGRTASTTRLTRREL